MRIFPWYHIIVLHMSLEYKRLWHSTKCDFMLCLFMVLPFYSTMNQCIARRSRCPYEPLHPDHSIPDHPNTSISRTMFHKKRLLFMLFHLRCVDLRRPEINRGIEEP